MPAPAPWRPGAGIVGLAIVIALLLIAGAAGAAVVVAERGESSEAERPARTVLVSPGDPAQPAQPAQTALEREMPALLRFVEEARGLRFTREVKVTLLGDGEFRRRLLGAEDPRSPDEIDELKATERVLQGLGLLDRGVDLEKAVESLFGSAVAGFYDTEKDDLVVRGEELTPGRRVTLVHELTHALQDQHFDINRPDLDERDDEASQGLTGLVEGDAVRIERMYLDSLPLEQQKAIEAEEAEFSGGIDPSTPEVLLQLVGFPYIVGPRFVEELIAAGGQARLDAAFVNPPTTSEQLLHPERYLAGDAPKEVSAPRAEGKVIDEGVLGELGLLLFLSEVLGDAAPGAASGWGGDRYVAWAEGRRTCVRANIVMDTPEDGARLRRALERVANRRKAVSVGRGNQGPSGPSERGNQTPATVTSCG
ncbi:MAG: hypothetical protein KY454_01425 [Actinobacteria bacterium]|nr:hypothetical protein [Actinomycetota bacterium]MBW3651968.1 hypothetical protein [Actinomycetota bacterium]